MFLQIRKLNDRPAWIAFGIDLYGNQLATSSPDVGRFRAVVASLILEQLPRFDVQPFAIRAMLSIETLRSDRSTAFK